MEDLLKLFKDAQWAMAKGKWLEMDIDRRINAAVSEAAQQSVHPTACTCGSTQTYYKNDTRYCVRCDRIRRA